MRHIKYFLHHRLSILVTYGLVTSIVVLQALGILGGGWSFVSLFIICLYILVAPIFNAFLLAVSLIPWYTVVPSEYSQTLAQWRFVFALLFVRAFIVKLFRRRPQKNFTLHIFKEISEWFTSFDGSLLLFLVFAGITLLWTTFFTQGVKELLFIVNIYLLYVTARMLVSTKQEVQKTLLYLAISTAVIVTIGFLQWLLSFFLDFWFFWQYWAVRVSSLYYGSELASVLQYSNSWFADSQNGKALRMFSILPDSHSFALVAVYGIAFLLPFILLCKNLIPRYGEKIAKRTKLGLWYIIRFFGLAVVLSGTRGVWVGMLLPLVVLSALYVKRIGRPLVKKLVIPILLIILFFPITLVLDAAFHYVHQGSSQNPLGRALSIVDKSEASNKGRIAIWKQSLDFAFRHPFGVGINNFIVSLEQDKTQNYKGAAETLNETYNLPQRYVTAHNLYLQVLVELGVIGLVLFFVLVWSILKTYSVYVWQNINEITFESMAVSGWLLVLLWLLGYAFFDVTLLNDRVLMYTLLGLAVTSRIIELGKGDPSEV